MVKKRSARLAILACASLASLGLLAGASPAAAKTKTKSFNRCVSTAVAIPDQSSTAPNPGASVAIPVSVPKFNGKPQTGKVTRFIALGVRITHTFDSDLVLSLVSPGGKVVPLAVRRGENAAGYGSGTASCAGSLALFGDTFPTPIRTPGNTPPAPITGSFHPEGNLSSVVGGPAKGNWVLSVVDALGGDVGAINAFSLSFTYKYKVMPKKKKR